MLKALVDTTWLEEHHDDVKVLDVRMDPRTYGQRRPASLEEARRMPVTEIGGRIPGSHVVPWSALGVTRVVRGKRVHGMRPRPVEFERLLRKLGVCQDDHLVVTSRAANVKELAAATRLYWLLRHFGHDRVSVLDGGVAQWSREGRPLAKATLMPRRGGFRVCDERRSLVATAEDVEAAIRNGTPQLLDSRAPDHYLGLTHVPRLVPASAKGHLPGAKMFCAQLVADRMGPVTLYDGDEIRQAAEVFGTKVDQPSITYCVSGVLCTLTWSALYELLGNRRVSVFDGSMHEWSRDPARPVVRLRLE